MPDDEKDYAEENRRRMLVSLAILLGWDGHNDAPIKDVPKTYMQQARRIYQDRNLGRLVEQEGRMPEREVQVQVAEAATQQEMETARDDTSGQPLPKQLYRIVGQKDDRTCPDCAAWQGRIVVLHPDGAHLTVEDFINNHGFHPNCRCSLQEVETAEKRLNSLNPRYDARRAANPQLYNQIPVDRLVFN